MTLLDHIEGLAYLREKAHQQAARLTIEIAACEDVLQERPPQQTYHHAEQRAIYDQSKALARQIRKQEPKEPQL